MTMRTQSDVGRIVWVWYGLACVGIAVGVAAVFGLLSTCSSGAAEYRDAAAEVREVQRMVEVQQVAQEVDERDIPSKLQEAMDANGDVCAWVYVPGTNVSLPILQNIENDRVYVDKSVDGSADVLGATFIEKESSPLFIDPVTVVYGHAFEDYPDVMFGQLHLLEDEAFFKEHETFFIYLTDRVLEYRIACACDYYGEHIPSVIRMGDAGTLQRYMNYALDPNVINEHKRAVGELDASKDRMVQFSTCSIPSSGTYRYVVTGVLVDERML